MRSEPNYSKSTTSWRTESVRRERRGSRCPGVLALAARSGKAGQSARGVAHRQHAAQLRIVWPTLDLAGGGTARGGLQHTKDALPTTPIDSHGSTLE